MKEIVLGVGRAQRTSISLAASLLLASGGAFAQTGPVPESGEVELSQPAGLDMAAPVTTLDAALERAYWTNPSLLAERTRLESTNFRLPQARARSGPQLSFEAAYGFERENMEQFTGSYVARSGWAPTASAVLTQPLFTFGRNSSSERAALAQIDYQRAALRATEQQVTFQAVASYIAVRRDRAAVQIAKDNLALLERELADNASRYKARDTTRTDVQQVGTRVELGRAQLLQAQRSAAASEAAFLKVTGSPAGELAAPTLLPLPVRTLEEGYALAQQYHPVLVAAYARERLSRAEVEGAKAERRLRVDLRGRAGVDTSLVAADRLRQTRLSGEVVVSGPLFQSGMLTARLHEAEAANDADWRLIDGALRESRLELSDAWNEWLASEASLGNLITAVQLAEQAHAGAVQQERVGMRTTLDVLDLARDLLSARINLNAAVASAQTARVRVLAAAGLLERGNVAPQSARYEVEPSYRKARNDGDIPVITPILQALDRIPLGNDRDRDIRDPSASLLSATVPVVIPDQPSGTAEQGISGFEDYLQKNSARVNADGNPTVP